MPDRIVSHALEQVEESHDVAVDVGIGVFDRIAYAGLCRQIDDGIEFFSSEQVLQGLSVFEVHLDNDRSAPVVLSQRDSGECLPFRAGRI